MKERSVLFYKRVIIITSLSIIIGFALIIALCIGKTEHAAEKPKVLLDIPVIEMQENHKLQTTGQALRLEEKQKPVTEAAVQMQTPKIGAKMVYLTFDDGASQNTEQILQILEEENVKATFFFNTNENRTSDNIIKEAYDNGHSIGVLTSAGGNYDTIYSSVDNYLEDFNKSWERLYNITGQKPQIVRFPGGSINTFNKHTYSAIIDAVTGMGYVYFDWNVCGQDSAKGTSKSVIVQNATKLPIRADKCILLMHDNGNDNTCFALKEIIAFYKEKGYEFGKLTADVEPITF